MPWKQWSEEEKALKDGTGLSRDELDWVYEKCKDQLFDLRLHKRASPKSGYHMSVHNMLVLTLHWLRKTPSFHSLAAQYPSFGITTLETTIYQVLDILYSQIVPLLIHPIDSSAPSSRKPWLEKVKIIIDSTHIPLPPTRRDTSLYHPKSKTGSALKFEVDCDLTHRIICCSNVVKGSVNDMRLVRQSGILSQMDSETKAIGDKGYVGQLGIITRPRKKRKVSREVQKLQSRTEREHELETERAAIENINQRLKQWKIIDGIWRQQYNDFNLPSKVAHAVCALVNLTLEEHPIRHDRQPLANR